MTIPELLKSSRTIAVVGLSNKRFRPSHGVAEYMQRNGYRIIPVNPFEQAVLGEKCYPDLESVPERVDIVDIFRRAGVRAGDCGSGYTDRRAGRCGCKKGVVHEEAAERARGAGLVVVMDRCILKDHRRVAFGG
jgi:predicted CoA-binding protein